MTWYPYSVVRGVVDGDVWESSPLSTPLSQTPDYACPVYLLTPGGCTGVVSGDFGSRSRRRSRAPFLPMLPPPAFQSSTSYPEEEGWKQGRPGPGGVWRTSKKGGLRE